MNLKKIFGSAAHNLSQKGMILRFEVKVTFSCTFLKYPQYKSNHVKVQKRNSTLVIQVNMNRLQSRSKFYRTSQKGFWKKKKCEKTGNVIL